jgi:hypothetical protein
VLPRAHARIIEFLRLHATKHSARRGERSLPRAIPIRYCETDGHV